jgi:hypothetical protein
LRNNPLNAAGIEQPLNTEGIEQPLNAEGFEQLLNAELRTLDAINRRLYKHRTPNTER